jgi:ketosteroid isomerase-like protein
MRTAFLAVAALAACAPAAEPPAAAGPAALDSVAARLAVEALSQKFSDAVVAVDPAAVAATFAEDATTSYFGFPTTSGRANIQSLYAAAFGASRPVSAAIVVGSANGAVPGLITALGTNAEKVDSAGTMITNYWRWAAAIRLEADGQWRWAYSMAFPDSSTRQ